MSLPDRWGSYGSGWRSWDRWGSYRTRYTPPPQTRSVIKHHRFDELNYADARKTKGFEKNITDLFLGDESDGRPGYDNAPELVEDLYYAFLKFQPQLERVRNVKPDARLNLQFLKSIMELPEFERIHDLTAGDPVMAALAVMNMFDTLREAIKKHEEQINQSNESKRGEGCGPSGRSRTDGKGDPNDNPDNNPENAGKGDSSGGKGQGDWDNELGDNDGSPSESQGSGEEEGEDRSPGDGSTQDFESNFEDMLENLDEQDMADLDSMFSDFDVDRLMNSAMKASGDQLDELETTRKSFGLDPATWRQADPSKRLQIANQLNTPQMKALADIMGRMVPYAMGQQATKIIEMPNNIKTVEMGNDLRRTVRSEFALLATEETKAEFYRKFIDGELLQFRTEGIKELGKGPLVICVDNSGSMSGDPENWAKGVCEALRRICSDQERDCFVMFFESNHHRERFEFPGGHADLDTIMKYLSISAGGGTQFDGVLTEALARCTAQFDDGGKSKADIVFITDGESYLEQPWIEKFNEERKRIGTRVFSVFINGWAYDMRGRGGPLDLLEQFSDQVIHVKELTPDAMGKVFGSV